MTLKEMRQSIDPHLKKKRNRAVLEYIELLEEQVAAHESNVISSAGNLEMNNKILEVNFQNLVEILEKLDAAIKSIRESIVSPSGAVGEVISASDKMGDSSHSIYETIEVQSASLIEFFAVFEELAASIKNVAASTNESRMVVNQTVELVNSGSGYYEENLNAIKAISESSKEIAEITQSIQGIAGQSNLLAMNAAIEAAHAGNQGRGFAVVAEEMRKLSDISNTEALKIGKITSEIISRIDKAFNATQQVHRNNSEIKEIMGRVNDITNEIQTAMQEQSSGIEQVLQEVNNLTEGTSSMKDATLVQREAGEALKQSIDQLNAATEQVKMVLDMEEKNRNSIVDIINKIGRTYLRNINIHHDLLENA